VGGGCAAVVQHSSREAKIALLIRVDWILTLTGILDGVVVVVVKKKVNHESAATSTSCLSILYCTFRCESLRFLSFCAFRGRLNSRGLSIYWWWRWSDGRYSSYLDGVLARRLPHSPSSVVPTRNPTRRL